jgi:hypothetical protein
MVAVCFIGCRSPTEIDLTVTTDVPCDGVTSTDLQLSSASGATEPTSTSTRCDAQGAGTSYLGKLVILPDPAQSPVEILVVTGIHQSADSCMNGASVADAGPGAGCIFERRTWSFNQHEVISASILMPAVCENVACGAGTTCTPVGGAAQCLPIPACGSGGCSSVDASVDAVAPSESGTDAHDSSAGDSGRDGGPVDGGEDGPAADGAIGDATVEGSPTFPVGGTVSGFTAADAGTPLVLQDNGGDNLSITASGMFTFATPIAAGASYDVTVQGQPQSPSQTCIVTAGTGTVGDAAVSSVGVTCTVDSFAVGGMVMGLEVDGGTVTLQNGPSNTVAIGVNGAFITPTPIASGLPYEITVVTQPPGQTCLVSNGSGIVGNANVTSVVVTCMSSNLALVSGTLTGLGAGDTLTLLDNGGADAGGDTLTLVGDGPFMFAMPLMNGLPYSVTVQANPVAPVAQTCTVTGGSGTAASDAGPTNVAVTCTTSSFALGGTITGLAGAVKLDSGVAWLGSNFFTTNGSFTFLASDGGRAEIASGTAYAVTVIAAPVQQICTVASGSGTVGATDVTSVAVACGYQITANVYAPAGKFVFVTLDTFPPMQTSGNGLLTAAVVLFPEGIAGGTPYTVTGTATGLNCLTNPLSPVAGSTNAVSVTCM